ncbi:MAG: hypothetical protein DHS20C13_26620 [Thermodesulfobacteriota bacterium]|nr:MAG: hypothetical protein DHS20C13_26620 [Thermodesulfobacteriota bacterium]
MRQTLSILEVEFVQTFLTDIRESVVELAVYFCSFGAEIILYIVVVAFLADSTKQFFGEIVGALVD